MKFILCSFWQPFIFNVEKTNNDIFSWLAQYDLMETANI